MRYRKHYIRSIEFGDPQIYARAVREAGDLNVDDFQFSRAGGQSGINACIWGESDAEYEKVACLEAQRTQADNPHLFVNKLRPYRVATWARSAAGRLRRRPA